MERLNRATLERQGYQGYWLKEAPERVLQFGEGNFLRAFVDYWFDLLNERVGFDGKVVLVQPIANGLADFINEQDGLYTLFLRGAEEGQRVNRQRLISSVSRCINPYKDYEAFLKNAENPQLRFLVSNTTEAGIVYDAGCQATDTPPSSFPAKLTLFLKRRFDLRLPGFIILSCELIDHNGEELKRCVLEYVRQWGLGAEFAAWVEKENIFCTTLVDRIVPGYPRAEAAALCAQLGYEDKLLDTGEVFGFWAIEGPAQVAEELRLEKAGLPIVVLPDITPYKQRKVRILNGAHTSFVLAAYLAGESIVRDCMANETIRTYMNETIYEEIIPTLSLDRENLMDFAAQVQDRFANPFIDHQLLSIALNSTSKWKARCMPSVLEYHRKFGKLPRHLVFSFAAYLCFYHNGQERGEGTLLAKRADGTPYEIKDDAWVLDFFYDRRADSDAELASAVIHQEQMWDGKLAALPGFEAAVIAELANIRAKGMLEAMKG